MTDQGGIPDGKHWCQLDARLSGTWRDGDVQGCRWCYIPPATMPRSVKPRSAVEYAWRQPDGVIAPVLATEGYDLMVWVVCDWVPVLDLVKLALKPGQFAEDSVPATGEALDAERRGETGG